MSEIGEAEGIGISYVSRLLRLTSLAPDIMENILNGQVPAKLELARLMNPFPSEWERQRTQFCPKG